MMYPDLETLRRGSDADKVDVNCSSYFQANCNQIFEKGPAFTKEILGKVHAEMMPKRTQLFGYEMKTGKLFLVTGLCMIFLFSCFGTTVMLFTNLFDNYVLSQLIISNGSDAFRIWENPTPKALYSFHIFNYTNIGDYELGNDKKPHVQEIGPYVYSENLERIDVRFNDEAGTVSYREKKTYTYRPDLSQGSQEDRAFVPNIPLISGSSMVQKENYFARLGFSGLLSALEEKAFLHIDIDSFISGYEDRLYSLSANYFKWQNVDIPKRVGLLGPKVGESNKFITMNTGIKDINRLALVEEMGGEESLGLYAADSCNSIEGTDGSMYPPKLIREKQPLHIMFPEFCRRIPIVFMGETKIMEGKVPAYTYTIPEDVFDTPDTKPENECFCVLDGGKCPLKGLSSTSGCNYGSPIYLSYPHFHNADPRLLKDVTGLDPESVDFRSYLNLQPSMGFMMTGRNVMQLNIKVNKAFGVSQVDIFEDEIVLPIAWVEVFLDEPNLPKEFVDLINFVSITLPCVQLVATYGSLLTSIFSFIGILLVARRIKNDNNFCLQRISRDDA
ncbi:unnamed protein product [Phaedon cochleariae]|uniref:Scavenger receptor class B member 1 n=1 Tax=Phaedon cochleariae TaxID=80249 RepID=A0A9P0DEQ9_PHACE|nr:unnamed protein product [Phaedon cochleariae]